MGIAAIGIHDPNFPLAAAVGEKGDLRTIGRPGRGGAVVLGIGQQRWLGQALAAAVSQIVGVNFPMVVLPVGQG